MINLSRVWLAALALGLSSGFWVSLRYMWHFWEKLLPTAIHYTSLLRISHGLLLLSFYGLVISVTNAVTNRLNVQHQKHPVWRYLLALMESIKFTTFLVILNLGSVSFGMPAEWKPALSKVNQIGVLAILGWCAWQLIQAGEALLLQRLSSSSRDTKNLRQRYTHIAILKRILTLLLVIMTGGSILMTFEKIRAAGTAILASAGVFASIVALSSRGVLESIFKGLQLAIAQPVRLGDTVTVSGETGTVTSINLHHVVVTLRDQSQLIVPTGEFLEKTFKNWTHSTDELVGAVFLSVNSNVPVAAIRKKFSELLKVSQYWDQKISEVQVSDLKKNLVELKLIMSAKSVWQLSKLRHEILEQLLEYMQTNYPDGFAN